ncbi:MAG: hypothetical protein DIU52_007105, partial [bacterium]
PGAPVSMPLHWEELDGLRSARAFTLADVPARLEAEGDAWRGVLRRRGSVARALLRLEKERGG